MLHFRRLHQFGHPAMIEDSVSQQIPDVLPAENHDVFPIIEDVVWSQITMQKLFEMDVFNGIQELYRQKMEMEVCEGLSLF